MPERENDENLAKIEVCLDPRNLSKILDCYWDGSWIIVFYEFENILEVRYRLHFLSETTVLTTVVTKEFIAQQTCSIKTPRISFLYYELLNKRLQDRMIYRGLTSSSKDSYGLDSTRLYGWGEYTWE